MSIGVEVASTANVDGTASATLGGLTATATGPGGIRWRARSTCVANGSAAPGEFLQPPDPLLHRRVGGEQPGEVLPRPERVGDHQVRLRNQPRLRGQRPG